MGQEITPRMVSLVESEAARCRAQAIFYERLQPGPKGIIDFSKEWHEVAEALHAAAGLMRDTLEGKAC